MLAYIYVSQGNFQSTEKPKPELADAKDTIVRVTLKGKQEKI